MELHEILELGADYLYLDQNRITSPSRLRSLVDARRMIAAEMYERCQCTLQQVAEALGRSNHTTIISLLDGHKYFLKNNSEYREKYRKMQNALDRSMSNEMTEAGIIAAANMGLI